MSYLNQDYHIHTRYSFCGWDENRPEAILRQMARFGFKTVGFSDHLHPITDPAGFTLLRQELAAIETEVTTLVGTEAEVLNPHVTTVTAEDVEMFDYIILSPNHFHLGWVEVPPLLSPRKAAEYVLAMHRKAASTVFADIIAHPFAKAEELGDEAEVLGAVKAEEIADLVELAKANGVAFEFRLENGDQGPLADVLLELYRQCHNRGCKVSSGSDSHWLESLGHTQTLGPAVQRAGLTEADFLDLSHRARTAGQGCRAFPG